VARTLSVRLDDETAAALAEQEASSPERSAAEIIREAIGASSSVVYFVRRSDRAVKVGCTASIKTRLSALRGEYGQITLEALMAGGREEEKSLHERLREEQLDAPRTEWFRGDRTEAAIAATTRRWGKPGETLSLEEPVAMCVRIPKKLFNKLTARRDAMCKENPMVSLSDAVCVTLEDGLRGAR
jgi:predicted transcriptional regulator